MKLFLRNAARNNNSSRSWNLFSKPVKNCCRNSNVKSTTCAIYHFQSCVTKNPFKANRQLKALEPKEEEKQLMQYKLAYIHYSVVKALQNLLEICFNGRLS